jgi:hypothetical protein
MPSSKVVPWFLPQNYDAIKRALKNDPNLPVTYDEWFNLQTKQVAEIEARGTFVEKVNINPDEFARYCASCGQKQNDVMLRAFAIVKKAGRNR